VRETAAETPGQGIAAGPPTRGPDSENFPTASLLLARPLRAKVLAFYRVVRLADDIADSPDLEPGDKLRRLDLLDAALDDPATAIPEAAALRQAGAGLPEARRVLTAFRQDATQHRYADWADLIAYCDRSAAPVGRFLLTLHEEPPAAFPAADALCNALQILNHLQDLAPDRERLGRVYLPQPWLDLAGGEARVFADAAARRPVLDAVLDRCEALLDAAASLPRGLRSARLRVQSAMTLGLARRLLARLRAADPILSRVVLTKADFAFALLRALAGQPSDASIVRARVSAARSSFALGMASLPAARRRAQHALYAFCRAVDDIADAPIPEAEKRRFLAEWRGKLDTPDCALSREFAAAAAAFALPRDEAEAMIAGMETDATPGLRLPDMAAFDLYCRRVAGSVGAMSVRIFGAPDAEAFGLSLGRTLQIVNVLRDLDEDAARGRVYLPRDVLAAEGLPPAVLDGDARALLADPRIAGAARALAACAEAGFAEAEAMLRGLDPRPLLPARIMLWGYRRLLARLIARGFGLPRDRPRLTRAEKARMAAFALRLAAP
jgi:phytoene synthase